MNPENKKTTDNRLDEQLRRRQEYAEKLERMIGSGTFDSMANEERVRNAEVMKKMLEHTDTIEMFCGEMSVFCQSFYDHIDSDMKREFGTCKSSDNTTFATTLRDEMTECLEDFFSRDDSKITILVQNWEEFNPEQLIDRDLFEKAEKDGRLRLYRIGGVLPGANQFKHFAIGERKKYKMLRLEENKDTHSALVMVNLFESSFTQIRETFRNFLGICLPASIMR